MEPMKVLDLFSGIGGFSLGLERAGMETVAFCEIEKYPCTILKKHWPEVPIFNDVRTLTRAKLNECEIGSIDVICGGFPCQPFSTAGKRRGKEDDRHLWPEMLRLIKECKPTWVVGENVAGFVAMALDDVLSDLENEGYEVQTFIIPACAVGAIHRRDRVWIVAYSEHGRRGARSQKAGWKKRNAINGFNREARSAVADTNNGSAERKQQHGGDLLQKQKADGCNEVFFRKNATNTGCIRLQRGAGRRESCEKEKRKLTRGKPIRASGTRHYKPIPIPTEPAVRHRNDGLPDSVARLKALGNAVAPQIPEMIGRAIMQVMNWAEQK